MSSTGTIQLSDTEIEALAAEIEAVSSKAKAYVKPVLRALLDAIHKPTDASPLLQAFLSRVQAVETVTKINASETSAEKISEVFGLGREQAWSLVEDGLVEVPSMLKRNLRDLADALCDEGPEATCRIAVSIMLVQCQKYIRNKYQSTETSHDTDVTVVADVTNRPTPAINKPSVGPTRRVKLFPDASLSIQMCDPFDPHRQILVTGRADWAFGYSKDGDDGGLLVAIKAKQASEFSKGQAQLITYLAILRENRKRAKNTNSITQGFYTDGSRYEFICIAADGSVNRSRTFDTRFASDLKMIFNSIVTMMETAMKSTPNASPTKPCRLQEKEVGQFKGEVWLKVFRHVVVVDSDGDMENVIDLS